MTNTKNDFNEDEKPLSRDCDCDGWNQSMDQINSAQMLAHTHGQSYTGKFFNYCPWCGVQIRDKKSSPSSDNSFNKKKVDEGFAKWMMTTKRKTLNPAWMVCNKEAFEEGYRTALEKDKS